MLLAIDVGNTNLRLGMVRDGILGTTRRAATPAAATPDEIEILLGALLGLDGSRLDEVGSIALASTVPATTAAIEAVAARRALACLAASALTIPLQVLVDRPGDVGPDRLVNAYAAAHLYGAPAIVVDCGTRWTMTARSWAAPSPPASSWASRRSRHGRHACRASSRTSPMGRSGATPPPRSGRGPSWAIAR
jgi:type III pantothenate kinase